MKKFNQTVGVLVAAYFAGTLQHGWCSACAVGNLVAHALGTLPVIKSNTFACGAWAQWDQVFITGGGRQGIYPENYVGEAKRQIDATGYTWEELARVERAFESVEIDEVDDDQRMFLGLMAVVDVLADIHGVDLTTKDEAKALFVR